MVVALRCNKSEAYCPREEMEFHRVVVQGTKTSSKVAEQILEVVRSGRYDEGTRLPSERELARLMGVSRNSVREALSALQIAGFVDTRVGDGTYVSERGRPRVAQKFPLLAEEGIDFQGIWSARDEIEQVLTHHALEKASSSDVDALESILSDMRDAVSEADTAKFSLSDVAFHLYIANLSDSYALVRAEQRLLSVSRQFYRTLDHEGSPRSLMQLKKSLSAHQAIALAIERRDPISAATALSQHYSMIREYLTAVFAPCADAGAIEKPTWLGEASLRQHDARMGQDH